MNCPSCGELNKGTKFCINCGFRMEETEKQDISSIASDFGSFDGPSPAQEQNPYGGFSTDDNVDTNSSYYQNQYGTPAKSPLARKEWTPVSPSSQYVNSSGKNYGIYSIIVGVVGFSCMGFIGGIGAIILGSMAQKYESEKRLGKIGIVIGAVNLAFYLLMILLSIIGNL